jgi:type III secretion protein Q
LERLFLPYAEKRLIEAQNALMLTRAEGTWKDQGGGQWRLRLTPPFWPEYWRAWAGFRWGSATVLILADGLPPGPDFLPGVAPGVAPGLPPVLLAAGLEAWLGEALETFGRGADLPPLILEEAGVGEKAADRTGDRPGFVLSRIGDEAAALRGGLAFSPEAAPLLEALAASLGPAPPAVTLTWPVPARLEVGAGALTPAELRSLRPGDILFPDEYFPRSLGGPRLCLSLADGGRLLISGRSQGQALIVRGWRIMNAVENPAPERPDPEADQARPAPAESGESLPEEVIDSLTVPVTLELDSLSLPLAEVRALRPGYVLETGQSLESPITIRAAGRVVGTGELLDVAGRIGVRLRKLTSDG